MAIDHSPISIRQVKSRGDLRTFIYFPAKVHAKNSNWLPPVYADEWNFFNPKKNRSFSHCNTIMMLAYEGKKPVGRIMGIINHTHNRIHDEKVARFGYLECYNSSAIASRLLSEVEEWAKGSGMNRLIGPYGFSDKDPQGLLIDGFEHMPILDSACNMPYLVDLVEKEGYTKEFDCFIYKRDLNDPLPESYSVIAQRVARNNGYTFFSPKKRSELKPLIVPILQLVNETYSHLYGFIPMEQIEMVEFAKRYLPIVDPRFVHVAKVNNQIVGFILGLPNFSPGLQKAKGRLFPLGLIHILNSMKRTKQLDLMLGAVEKSYRGRGVEIALAIQLIAECKKAQLDTIEIHLVLESNTLMLAELKRAGCQYHKSFRVFGKEL